ncbi:MAG: hypothetical protein HY934_11025 [Candidatus Firestonebacteria bacterium]|nr:hypothetical protein [Candidatus Firestonebacteria bacterium]
MKIISNSSPLILLTKIKRIKLLKQMFLQVYIPEEVYNEVYKVKNLCCPEWIEIMKVKDSTAIDALEAIIDRGESESIILAKEMGIKIILMDDKKGINLAKRMELEPIRTTSLIGIAYQKGLISNLKAELNNLQQNGCWITDYYIEEILFKFKKS